MCNYMGSLIKWPSSLCKHSAEFEGKVWGTGGKVGGDPVTNSHPGHTEARKANINTLCTCLLFYTSRLHFMALCYYHITQVLFVGTDLSYSLKIQIFLAGVSLQCPHTSFWCDHSLYFAYVSVSCRQATS